MWRLRKQEAGEWREVTKQGADRRRRDGRRDRRRRDRVQSLPCCCAYLLDLLRFIDVYCLGRSS